MDKVEALVERLARAEFERDMYQESNQETKDRQWVLNRRGYIARVERIADGLATLSPPSPDAEALAERLESIKRSESYLASVMKAYGSLPRNQLFDDLRQAAALIRGSGR